jgi:hypothetical protein
MTKVDASSERIFGLCLAAGEVARYFVARFVSTRRTRRVDDSRTLIDLHYFSCAACQLKMTVIGAFGPSTGTLTRNRLPSRVTSYRF